MLRSLLEPGEVDRTHLFGGAHAVSILTGVLRELYGIHDATVTPIEHGHTNASFLVTANGARYVLRRAWAGKPAAQIADEEHVLARLAAPCDVPRIVPALTGATHAVADGRVHHLFGVARGDLGPRYLGRGDHARMRAAMIRLAQLHRALAAVPCGPGEPWLRGRLLRIQAGPPGVEEIRARIHTVLPACASPQWVHGDYHLGNLLWTGDEVTGIVDFDDIARGSVALEAGMALFALARQPAGEDAFVFDADLLETGRAAYAGPIEGSALAFCAYQVLIHLEAAQRGLWQLTDSIGFWPCWHSLMRA
jgi:Ser/Thr protein kinase RdoA (MazF antagonist)